MKNALPTFALLLLLSAVAVAQVASRPVEALSSEDSQNHYYVPMREVEMEIKDFDFATLDGKTIKLNKTVKGKKLVLVHYFAAWCHNSNFDVKTMMELHERYKDQGFTVIGVCEYSSSEELRDFIEKHKPTYPICMEGDGKTKDRTGTTHYAYRKQMDDSRLWGTPLNILLTAEDIRAEAKGKFGLLSKHARVAAGEVIKSELEELIREKLSQK